ncbi:MAG TPA: glycosyltransferase [Thermoplasmata archaeon]|nr:glycosyltransferase [Thermoplasmata archaeon]
MGSEPVGPPFVSVVITTRNEEPHVGGLLESLAGQEPPFEVVLVDAESRDRTVAVAEEFGARHPGLLRIVRKPCSRGGGRNLGVKAARADYVAFIDGDCVADPHWLATLRRGAGPSTVVAGRTLTLGKPKYGELERVELFQGGYDVTYPSCNLLYPRALFDRLGGFDTRFITAEDIDLNLRAVRDGTSIRYDPEAIVLHHMRGTFVRFLYQAFWNGYGRKQLTEKHGSLWPRYRLRRLLAGQKGVIAWARLTAALAGYATRMITGPSRRQERDREISAGTPTS